MFPPVDIIRPLTTRRMAERFAAAADQLVAARS
jgi:hypothetical protein